MDLKRVPEEDEEENLRQSAASKAKATH